MKNGIMAYVGGCAWNSIGEGLVNFNFFIVLFYVSLYLITSYFTRHPVLVPLVLTFLSATVFIYTMNRYTDRQEDQINHPRRFYYLDRYGTLALILAGVLYLASLSVLFFFKFSTFFIGFLPLVLAIIYSVFRMKRIFLLKNIVVTAGIMCAAVIVLVTFDDMTSYSLLLIAFFSLGALINTIIYDIKDIEGDVRYHIQTLPGIYGVKNTKMVCYVLLIISVLMIPALISFSPRSYLLLIYTAYIGAYVTFVDAPHQLPHWCYYGIIVDGQYTFLGACCGITLLLAMPW